jgi:hypothetical protein
MTRPRATALLAAIAALPLLLATVTPARAGGPIYASLKDLPRPIAKMHTCIGPRDRTLLYPDAWHVGRQRIFRVGCPESAPNVTVLPRRDDSGYVRKPDDDPDDFQSTVYYLADDARGRNARRLVLPYTHADGTTIMADAFQDGLTTGWSTREDTSTASGLAYFDVAARRKYPPGEFMIAAHIVPVDRPDIKNVKVIWRVKNGKAEMIYRAETKETRPKDAPAHVTPPYTIVLDKRPEK